MRRASARSLVIGLLALLVGGAPARLWAAEQEAAAGIGLVHGLIWYLPNRVFDVLDPVRARLRLGPGFGLSLRATEAADLFVGSYGSVYAGLPGPRGRHLPRLPVGLEARTGVEVSAADISTGGGLGPDYGTGECGIGLHAALLGVDVGVDPLELIDLVVGFVGLDPLDDDL